MQQKYTIPSVTSFIIKSLKPFWPLVVGDTLLAIYWAIDMSLRPYLIKIILDKVAIASLGTAFELLLNPILFYISMSILMLVSFYLYDSIWLRLGPNLKKNISKRLMKRMMGHSHKFYQNHFSGALANRINDSINDIPKILKTVIDRFFSYALGILIAIYTVWNVNIKFSLGLMIWVSFFIFVTLFSSTRAKDLSKKAAESKSSVMGHIVDILSNMINVRLFNGRKHEYKHLNIYFDNYVVSEQKRHRFLLKTHIVQEGSFVAFQSLCLWWLIVGLNNQAVTPGDFALILTINIAIIDCLWEFAKDIREFTEYIGNVAQSLHIIYLPVEIKDHPDAKKLLFLQGRITFDNVEFTYSSSTPLFYNKSITIEPGQKVGLVGYSGSGKSTFVNLILRFFDVTSGRILIDDQDIKMVTQESLHQFISMIPQEPSLFHRTLMENIRYGKPEASDEEVFNAAHKAHAHDFILTQPFGYNSLVGERGIKLSGGQKQRISIARAVLKNAPILILDEATSQLDSVTEEKIQNSLWDLMQAKTTIVIAHRLSTLLRMDRILVFEQGKIIEDGTHEILLKQHGTYTSLWNSQVGGFIPTTKKKDLE